MEREITVKILPHDENIKCKKGSNLLHVIMKSNTVHIDNDCAGNGTCGKCKVKLIHGELSEVSASEKKLLSKNEIENNIVLVCERTIIGDVVVEVSDENEYLSGKGEIVRDKYNSQESGKIINGILKKIYIELPKPTLIDHRFHINRIAEELSSRHYNNEKLTYDISIIRNLEETLLQSNYCITATIFDKEIVAIEGNDKSNENYGIVVDLGTTTVAAYLINLNTGQIIDTKSHLNNQKKYGADVISRINYSIQNNENKINLQKKAIETIDIVLNNILIKNNLNKGQIEIIGILGNTTMSHALIGTTINTIGKSPFCGTFRDKIIGKNGYLNLNSLDKNTLFIVFPNIGGYVGSDTLCAIIGSNMTNEEGNILLIDIGTNCEVALKSQDKILVCSTAAGPAFEGGNMKYGMKAGQGAIYDCEIDEDINIKLIYDNKIDSQNNISGTEAKGICGSGYISIVAKLLDEKIIKKQGRIVKPENLGSEISDKIKERIVKKDKSYEICLAENVSLTQDDISNLQLCKGAVKASIELLMKEANIDKLDKIILGGAFGSNLDLESIRRIKMIPDIDDTSIETLGNVAGKGGID
ncbi:MAG: ASKHA domain-containing protein, partial [Romboutsia sp.]|uniref:ASKHA domain-containing protein n=1 Tax=Romboutsia sp. TaxID=1965302 RepID=UPI003F3CAC92